MEQRERAGKPNRVINVTWENDRIERNRCAEVFGVKEEPPTAMSKRIRRSDNRFHTLTALIQ
jgi:hypothetical protein